MVGHVVEIRTGVGLVEDGSLGMAVAEVEVVEVVEIRITRRMWRGI